MRCPGCNVENEEGAAACSACQTPLPPKRKGRRRGDSQAEVPLTPGAIALRNQARLAWNLSLIGLVPFLGLLFGPASTLLAYRVRRAARAEPTFPDHTTVRISLRLGGVITAASWVGLGLMLLGLYL